MFNRKRNTIASLQIRLYTQDALLRDLSIGARNAIAKIKELEVRLADETLANTLLDEGFQAMKQKLKVIVGENAKLQEVYVNQGYQLLDLQEQLDQVLLDQINEGYDEDEMDMGDAFQ